MLIWFCHSGSVAAVIKVPTVLERYSVTFIVVGTLFAFFGVIFYFSLRRRLQLRYAAVTCTGLAAHVGLRWWWCPDVWRVRGEQATTDESRAPPLTTVFGRKQAEEIGIRARLGRFNFNIWHHISCLFAFTPRHRSSRD